VKTVFRNAAIALLAIAGLAALAPSASAAPSRIWGGAGFNDLGQSTVGFKVQNGRAKIISLQILLACTDTQDGTESTLAFSMGRGPTDTLNQNRFRFRFDQESSGRDADVKLNGRMGSNGRGIARANITSVGRDFETGAVIERCQGSSNIPIRRGPAS